MLGAEPIPHAALNFLRHCYRFVTIDWQHLPRNESPDQGFEEQFRADCLRKLPDWVVSQHREMGLGLGLITASGVLHEIDIVAQREPTLAILELKNRAAWPPEKNDVVVFFAKMLDYFCMTPALLRSFVLPAFISTYGFEQSGLAACIGLGVHPVAPQLRPIPLLVDNANRITIELEKGVTLSQPDEDAFREFRAEIGRVLSLVSGADANRRLDFFNDLTIAVRAFSVPEVHQTADELLRLNAECSRLIEAVKVARGLR